MRSPRLSTRNDEHDVYVAQSIGGKRPLIDIRAVATAAVIAIPGMILAVMVAWFAMSYRLEASTLELQRQAQDIVELKRTDAELRKADTERSIRDAETVARIAVVVQRIDDIVKRIEKVEDRR
jgi:hypothetical protein